MLSLQNKIKRRDMKRLFTITFIMLVCQIRASALPADSLTVRGYVLDKDGLPLPGAHVSGGDGAGNTAVTGSDGYFELGVGGGVRQLTASYVGFDRLTYDMERPSDVQVLVMTPNTRLDEVVVTTGGTGNMKNRFNILNTESVTSHALTRAACCNLSESFETNPSVDVAYSDAVTGAKQIQLLGLAGTYVQMLTENFPNLRGAASVYGLDYIPGPWMQSIQVSKGAASVKNGYESVTGQINVEYKKPKIADPLFVNVFASSAGRYEGNVVGAVELNSRLSTALFLNYYNERQEHDRNGDSFLDMPETEAFNIMNRWHYQTAKYVSQTGVKYIHDRRNSGQTAHTLHGNDGVLPYTITSNTDRIEAFSKNGFILDAGRNESVALIVAGSYHDLRSAFAGKTYDVSESNVYASLMYESEFGLQHKLAAGVNLNWDDYRQRGNVVEMYSPWWRNAAETVAGAYAEYTWTPAERLTVMAGLRGDHSSMHGWFATPRVHVKYAPAGWIDLRASAGKGYRTTLVLPENSYLLASSRTLHIAGDLKQESAWNYGLSASLYIPVGGRDITVNAEWYYTDFDNQVVTDMDRDAHAVYFYNLRGRSTSNVIQVDASYELFRGFTLMGAYRWMDVRCTYDGLTKRKPLTGRYKGLLTASYETKLKKWQIDLTVQFNGGGRMPSPDTDNPLWSTTYPAYAQLSAQVTRRFRKWNIYVGGENLTGYTQSSPVVAADNPYGPDFDATMVWGPTMGAKIYAGIRYIIPKI